MGYEAHRYPTGYELTHNRKAEQNIPSYPPEVLTPEQIAYEQRAQGTQQMSEAMARNVRGLRLMQEARESEAQRSGAA